MRRLLATINAVALATVLSTVVESGTSAVSAEAQGTTNCPGVVSEAQVSPPAGYTEVINAEMTVTNDEDSGFVGYWALDDYTKHLQVWESSTGDKFYVAVMYQGTWQTFAGALSPGTGVPEPSAGTGSIKGGYIATLSGPMLANPTAPTHGTVGTYNFAGTESDVLLGTYGKGQTGATAAVDWLSFYFTSGTIATFAFADNGDAWGWRYTGNSTSGPWCNTGTGASGDIVTH